VWLTLGALSTTVVVVGTALWLYKTSGAAQLDLSRPEYDGLREQAKVEVNDEFDETGPIDRETLNEFLRLYEARSETINQIKAFSAEPLSDSTLGLE
jgi:hypothetical protein